MTVLDDALDEHIRTLVNEALFTAPKENQKHIVVAEAQLKAFFWVLLLRRLNAEPRGGRL